MNQAIDIKGVASIQRALSRLPDELQRSGEAAALRAGAKPVTRAAKAKAPTDSGLLKKSIGQNVKRIRGVRTARIGPRLGWGKEVPRNGKTVFSDPAKYSHLIELGTSHSAAQPFIRPAIDSTRSEVVSAMADGLDRYVTRAVKRLRSKK